MEEEEESVTRREKKLRKKKKIRKQKEFKSKIVIVEPIPFVPNYDYERKRYNMKYIIRYKFDKNGDHYRSIKVITPVNNLK